MPVYPENPPYACETLRDVPEASSAVSRVTFGTHTGTHVDAPRHVVPDGAGADRVPLDRLVGPAHVLDLSALDPVITRADLAARTVRHGHIVLLKTRNSGEDPSVFHEDFVACDASAAAYLVERGAAAVGIDGPSIKKFRVKDETHQLLLRAGIPIIEGLDLSHVAAGDFFCVCLPLPLDGADGAPARAVLLSEFPAASHSH